MTFQLTNAQALKSFAGAAIFGLGMDMACAISNHLTEAAWFAVREGIGVLLWAALAGWQSEPVQVFGHSLFLLDCPLELVRSLGSLVHYLGAAV